MNWKSTVARFAALIILQALAGTAFPEEAAQPRISDEIAKQEGIYRSRGAAVPRGYVTDRALSDYEELLPSGFGDALEKLGPMDRWLDIGAGGGEAILDYYSRLYDAAPNGRRARHGARAYAVAVSIEDRRTNDWRLRAASLGGDRIRYLFGKPLREYSHDELGKFQIITDVYGGFSYTANLSLFMEKVLALLETNGSFYTLIQSVHLEDGKDKPGTWYLTDLLDAAGHDVKVCSWLKSMACVKVACESKSAWDTPTELIHVRKVCDSTAVPRLNLLQFEAGNPPGRRFQLAP